MNEEMPSKETMETDLKNTKKEIDAYSRILSGYKDLQSLPENSRNSFSAEIAKFDILLSGCIEFYETLQKLYRKYYGKDMLIK